ncbi:MAG: hypothetical protein A2X46_08845 [Lentisphaerae bacterium GWF2_57_35]|nr:MAG: hypothetical protein A2X46_08845 [Lentisphaerae bacterium GWF2_57_35]
MSLDLFSGVERAVEEISVRLAARGHEVSVVCRGRYNLGGENLYRGVRLKNLPAIYTKHLEAISHTALGAVEAMRGYDIVHFHATGPCLFSFLPRCSGRGVVATVHGLDWQREKWKGFAKMVLKAGAWASGRFPHRTIVVSRVLRQYYADAYGRPTTYIPNGIAPVVKKPLDRLGRFGVRPDHYILFLSRLVPEKGCHLLIRAFQKVQTDMKLLMVGGGSYTANYVESLRKMAASDPRIIFAGALYGDDKAEAFSNARFMVLPSTLEGMPIVLLEAMNYECPVLCSNIPANLDVVEAGGGQSSYAQTFECGSENDLVQQLKSMVESDFSLKETAARARQYVAREYSWDRVTDLTEEVYFSVRNALNV